MRIRFQVVHENWELALSLLPARGRKKSNLVLLSVMAYRGRWHEARRARDDFLRRTWRSWTVVK